MALLDNHLAWVVEIGAININRMHGGVTIHELRVRGLSAAAAAAAAMWAMTAGSAAVRGAKFDICGADGAV
jgi:hypothetical protein